MEFDTMQTMHPPSHTYMQTPQALKMYWIGSLRKCEKMCNFVLYSLFTSQLPMHDCRTYVLHYNQLMLYALNADMVHILAHSSYHIVSICNMKVLVSKGGHFGYWAASDKSAVWCLHIRITFLPKPFSMWNYICKRVHMSQK